MTDPIEIMARAMSADQGFAWEACSQGDWKKDATAAVRALDASGFAIVPKLPNEDMAFAGSREVYESGSPRGNACHAYAAMVAAGAVKPE